MKKMFLSALALIGLISFSIAQTAPSATTTAPAKPKMHVVKKAATTTDGAKVVPLTTTKPADKPAAGPLKKDGTPDKRFKANKTKTTGPLKKDGTPDMRYKANKASQ